MDSSPEVFTKEEGLRLLRAGQINDAISVLEKVREKTDDAQVCSFLGAAYDQKGDKVHAIHAFEECLRLNETPKAYYNLAVVYESVHRIDEAVREYKMAVELDPNYALAAQALKRLHDQFEAVRAQPEPAAATAQPTQSMPAGPPPPSQTQSFAGPPPAEANLLARQMAKEQAIADQHHALMRSGLIYGAICGAIFFILLNLLGGLVIAMMGGKGWLWLVIQGFIGAIYGSLVGLWIGYTCGGEGAGFQAGAVIGLVYGVAIGLLMGSLGFMIGLGLLYGLLSGVVGLIIGRLVDMSISD